MNAVSYSFWSWLLFFVVVLAALLIDLGVAGQRAAHFPTRRETFAWSAVWISLAFAFNAFILWQFGLPKAKEFFTGYLIELSLSVDNLFVFLLIFNYFKVPKILQHRALFWGVFMALVLRMIMIFAGAELVERFDWILYLFGAFLVYTGFKMFSESADFSPEKSAIVRFATRLMPISKTYEGEKFFVRREGKLLGTLLLLVLIVVNVADLVFAVDSIPAIFGITTDRFIVYTSNIFAVLGLRTFFFLLLDMAERFYFLKYALAFVLIFIGLKMLLPLPAIGLIMVWGEAGAPDFVRRFVNQEFNQTITNLSLAVVVSALVLSIVLSLIFPPKQKSAGHAES